GNVGIGTTAPGADLHIHSTVADLLVRSSNSYSGVNISAGSGNSSYISLSSHNAPDGNGLRLATPGTNGGRASFDINSGSGYSTIVTLQDGGNVGIGTTGPDRKLDALDASNPQIRLTTTDGTVYADLQNSATSLLALSGSTLSASSGTAYGLNFTPNFSSLSGTAGYTALFVNATDGAGSGTENLLDLQVGSASKFVINNQGAHGSPNQTLTLGASATTFAVSSNVMTVTGDAGGNTIATITAGVNGQTLTIIFVDALVTISDDNTHAANSVDLSSAFTSADDTVLRLIFDGTSWYEASRSAN
ncbi:MAG: hypothetical protein CEN89_324, partial [Candidatus Berkelbacteria bacterium Licking1014_7]